jgi:hypothetical protein
MLKFLLKIIKAKDYYQQYEKGVMLINYGAPLISSYFFYTSFLSFYSHSKAPIFHAYKKPIINSTIKSTTTQNPKESNSEKEMAQGYKNTASISKIINRIATK